MNSNKHVFVISDPIKCESDSGAELKLQIITLRNPATGKPTKYLTRNDGNDLYELNQFSETNRSWFINETVCSNGRIYIPTRIDPLFLIIPYIERNCTSKAVPLDQVLVDDEFPHTEKLVDTISNGTQLSLIAEEKKAGSIKAYKYSESKTLDFLKRKCLRLELALGKECQFARSHNFIKEEKENEKNGEMLHYAHGVISDYLSLELSKKLGTALGLPEEKSNNKRKSTAEIEVNQIKKIKKEEVHETTPIKKVTSEKKVSAKSKALAKAANGTKSISSFFKK
ncbi:ribonuclease H2 subunit B [Toxorhynchites rutilus septentrionalis]|uniref:ribonuclease H2 subunit B n=1 Tax=Toxorhynchites rutilus septentrionalis TaxID=329112 RepID=UPI00247881C0|nr:ribonuclease H2 subunit B [Toxorhynchites rutilus septentrionalis]